MYSAAQSLSVSFGKVECSSVQISLARCSDCPVWYFPVQSRVVQCSAVWWGRAQSKTVQSSEVHAVQFSLLKCCPAQSHSTDARSSPIPIHSLPAKYILIQRSPGPYKSTAVESSLVQSSAVQSSVIRKSSAQSRPIQSWTTNYHRVQDTTVLLSRVRNNHVHCGPSSQVKCYSEKPTFKPIQVYFSPVLSSDVTPTQGRASTYIFVERSSLMIP